LLRRQRREQEQRKRRARALAAIDRADEARDRAVQVLPVAARELLLHPLAAPKRQAGFERECRRQGGERLVGAPELAQASGTKRMRAGLPAIERDRPVEIGKRLDEAPQFEVCTAPVEPV
jgi:hypothetical protein